MEQGEIASWNDIEKIRTGLLLPKPPLSFIIIKSPVKYAPVGFFYKHICSSCWSKDGKAYFHTRGLQEASVKKKHE